MSDLDDLKERHLRHVLEALLKYQSQGGKLCFRSENRGSLEIVFTVEDALHLDRNVSELIRADINGPVSREPS